MKSSADSNFPSGSYPGNEKLTNLQTFIHLVCPLPFFIYSTSPYALASTTAKNSDILRALLALDFHIADSLADFSAFLSTSISKQTFPIIQNNSLDIIWVADIEIHSGYSPFLHIMGPYSAASGRKNNVHTIASNTGYSDYYLSKKFKTEMGCSIKEYINQQKIKKAKQLLTSTPA